MKKLFTALALGAISVAAYAEPSFDNYVADPAVGAVTELSAITVTFPDFVEMDLNDGDAVMMVTGDFDDVVGTPKVAYGSNKLVFTLEEPTTAPGEYILIINEGALTGYYYGASEDEYEMVDSPEMYITYTIDGGGQEDELNFNGYTSEPAEGSVEALKNIVVTFPNMAELDINSSSDITVTHNGTPLEAGKTAGANLSVTLTDEATAPGEYVLTIAAGACCAYNESYDQYLDNPDDIVLKWTIESAPGAVDFTYKADPESGNTVKSLAEIVLEFPALNRVSVAEPELVEISLNDQPLEAENYNVMAEANVVIVTFNPAVTAENAETAVKVLFPAASLSGVKDDNEGMNSEAIQLAYNVVPAVVYDLTLAITTPRPNSEGEISADRSLNSMFFACDEAGLVAAEGNEPNVTIREVEGDFEASVHLVKGNGIDQTKSYFVANFNKEPSYNGAYEIVIQKGAFGNQTWAEDTELGRSNDELTLRFTLVDGRDRLQYTLKASEITPEEGTYSAGKQFTSITVKFDEPDVAMSVADVLYATLAGVDNDYNESAAFAANGDGSFTVEFPVAPTTDGTYMFSVLPGAFSAGNQLSEAISRQYVLDSKSSVLEIVTDPTTRRIYNLQGMPVSGKLPAGIYIIDGKKVRL